MPLEFFVRIARSCSRYLKGPHNLVLYVSEKIVTARHTNQKILRKTRKENIFGDFLRLDCSNKLIFLEIIEITDN